MVKIASPTVNAGAMTVKEINFSRLQSFFKWSQYANTHFKQNIQEDF